MEERDFSTSDYDNCQHKNNIFTKPRTIFNIIHIHINMFKALK